MYQYVNPLFAMPGMVCKMKKASSENTIPLFNNQKTSKRTAIKNRILKNQDNLELNFLCKFKFQYFLYFL